MSSKDTWDAMTLPPIKQRGCWNCVYRADPQAYIETACDPCRKNGELGVIWAQQPGNSWEFRKGTEK